MRICIHRGSRQIGGSCVETECTGERLLIDIGLPLDAEYNSSKYLPQITGLDGNDPSLLGILISHPHLDHFGLLEHVSPNIPVGMGPAARRILEAAAPFLPNKWPAQTKGWNYTSEQCFDIGHFCITPFLVDHAAYDAYALKIEGAGRSIFYSGDFRSHGRKTALFERLLRHPPANIDVMLLEGSSIGRIDDDQQFCTEDEIEAKLVQIFSTTEGLALVHCSAQNIDRIVSIMRASKKTGRKLVIDLYTAAILEATGNQKIPQSHWRELALFIPQSQRIQIKKNAWFDLLRHHSINRIYIEDLNKSSRKSTLLFRPLHRADLERGKCLTGASYVYSQWSGYWERGDYDMVKTWLEKNAVPKHFVHTSGHASPTDLKKLVAAINPNKVVPIHSFMPERYVELFPNVEIHNDGQWWEI
jgi:ribonuclease J